MKQSSIADSIIEAKYIAASKAAKESVWLKNFLMDLEVVPSVQSAITLLCDNSGAVANAKEPRRHKREKHIERKYHLIKEIVVRHVDCKPCFWLCMAQLFNFIMNKVIFSS